MGKGKRYIRRSWQAVKKSRGLGASLSSLAVFCVGKRKFWFFRSNAMNA